MNKIETLVLENGLKIYLYNDKRRHSTFFQLTTLFGGLTKDFKVNEKEYHFQDGIAHLLEHYLVECNEVGNFLKELGKRQMNTNASTHYDMTNFYFEAVEDVDFGIRTILNGIYNVKFDEHKLEKLKNPIYQEIRGKKDNKFYHANIMTLNNLFDDIKFRNIGGTIEEVESATIDDLNICYEAFYQPSNQFIVVAGNFDRDVVVNEIKKFYDNIDIKTVEVELITHKEKLTVHKSEDTLYFPTPLDYVELSFKLDISKLSPVERLDLDFYLGCFYNQFFGITSLLHKEFIDKKIITSGISCSDIKVENFLIVSIGSYTYDALYFKNRILEVLKELKYFNEEKFELEKKSAIVRIILRDENVMKMVMPFIDNIVNFNYPYLDKVSEVERLKYSDFVANIKKLDFSNYTITTIKEK